MNVPNRDLVDEYSEVLHHLVFLFIDTTPNTGRKNQADGTSLYKQIKSAKSMPEIEPHLASSDNLSIIWLAQCLYEVPITIYTDEDKRSLLKRIARTCEDVAAR